MNLHELFNMQIDTLWQHKASIDGKLLTSKAWLVVETNDGATYDVKELHKLTSDSVFCGVRSNDKNYQMVTIPAVSIRLLAFRFIDGEAEGTDVFRSALPESWPWHG